MPAKAVLILEYLNGFLHQYILGMIFLNFVGVVIGLFCLKKDFSKIVAKPSLKTLTMLLMITFMGGILRIKVEHNHLVLDEFLYMEAAKNMVLHHTPDGLFQVYWMAFSYHDCVQDFWNK